MHVNVYYVCCVLPVFIQNECGILVLLHQTKVQLRLDTIQVNGTIGQLFSRATDFADFMDFWDFHEICFTGN